MGLKAMFVVTSKTTRLFSTADGEDKVMTEVRLGPIAISSGIQGIDCGCYQNIELKFKSEEDAARFELGKRYWFEITPANRGSDNG